MISSLALLLTLSGSLLAESLTPAPTRDRKVVRRWSLPGNPRGLAVAADGTIYAGLAQSQSVMAINPLSGAILRSTVLDLEHIAATKELSTLRISSDGKRLVVANGSDESVTILSLPELEVVREIGLEGETIRDAIPDPTGRYLYVLGRTVHVFNASGDRELTTIRFPEPMAIASDSAGRLLAVVGSEQFSSGKATVVSLIDTTTWKEVVREPLQTDRVIEAARFGAGDSALIFVAKNWLGEKSLVTRAAKTMAADNGRMRIRFDFGDLVSSETVCLPQNSGPQILTAGPATGQVLIAERRCSASSSFVASERKVTALSIYGVAAFALQWNAKAGGVVTTDPAGYLTIYKVPEKRPVR